MNLTPRQTRKSTPSKKLRAVAAAFDSVGLLLEELSIDYPHAFHAGRLRSLSLRAREAAFPIRKLARSFRQTEEICA